MDTVKEISQQWSVGALEFIQGWINASRAFALDLGVVIAAGVKIAHARFLPTLRSLADVVETHTDATKLVIALPLVCFAMFGVWVTLLFTTGI